MSQIKTAFENPAREISLTTKRKEFARRGANSPPAPPYLKHDPGRRRFCRSFIAQKSQRTGKNKSGRSFSSNTRQRGVNRLIVENFGHNTHAYQFRPVFFGPPFFSFLLLASFLRLRRFQGQCPWRTANAALRSLGPPWDSRREAPICAGTLRATDCNAS